jgi:hypothetical protein
MCNFSFCPVRFIYPFPLALPVFTILIEILYILDNCDGVDEGAAERVEAARYAATRQLKRTRPLPIDSNKQQTTCVY